VNLRVSTDRLGITVTRVFDVSGAVGRAALLVLLLVMAQSFLWVETAPPSLKLGVALVGFIAFLRPASGPLIVAGLAPLGVVITNLWSAQPARVTEALVLACLAGYWLRSIRMRQRAPSTDTLNAATLALGIVAIASCIVVLFVFQAWQDYPGPFLERLVIFLARDYHAPPLDYRPWADYPGFAFVPTTALLLEGLILFHIVVTRCHIDSRYAGQIARALAIGAVGSAVLGLANVFVELTHETARLNGITQAFASGVLTRQQSAITSKMGAAGSYFVLMAPLSFAAFSRRQKPFHAGVVASGLICLAMWMTGSRVALVAAPAAALLLFPWRAFLPRRWRLSGLVLVATVLAFVPVALWIYRLDLFSPRTLTAILFRYEMVQTAMRMVAQHPLLGIGVGQYFLLSDSFSSPDLVSMMTTVDFTSRANAHNYFLQVTAELGLVGFAAFCWLLVAALVPTWHAYRDGRANLILRGAAGGVGAFLITCLASHPLLFEIIAYPFWLALGLCAALGRDARPELPAVSLPVSDSEPSAPRLAKRRVGMWAMLALPILVGSIPLRVAQDTAAIDFGRVTYGLHDWETNPAAVRFRWTGQRATFFVPGHTNVVDLPVRAVQIESLAPFVVEFRINGRRADDVRLEHDMWQRVRLTMPPQDHRNFHRIDLFVSPSWRPAELLPGSSDPRRLGVMFGEITVDGPGKSQRLLDDRPKGGVRSGLERFYAAATN
jgi:O-antigen ligase